MCVPLTSVLFIFTTVIIDVYFQCSSESVSWIDLGKSTFRSEIRIPGSIYLKAVKGAQLGSALSIC